MKDTAYLLLHGFGGSPEELNYLKNYLESKGLDVYSILLSGHGGGKTEMSKSKNSDWIKSAEDFYDKYQKEYHKICLIGFSMGGLLSTRLAVHDKVDKLVLVNTPVYFWNLKVIASDIFGGILHRNRKALLEYKKSIFDTTPIAVYLSFLALLFQTKKLYHLVKKPTLVLQCKRDEAVYWKSAEFIKHEINLQAKLNIYPGGCHQVFNYASILRDQMCEDIYTFLSKPKI
ncbi:MAG: alpha/beta fold hydrolase [Bacillota bacterium]|nr:alpha/beta fold hydrolase [Bacillota bacterium]